MKKIKNIQVDQRFKKIFGVILIIFGLILHIIPLFPAGWIIAIGFELVGIRLLLPNKIKEWFKSILYKKFGEKIRSEFKK